MAQSRSGSCCGGSAVNFGGCSAGKSQNLFNPENNEFFASSGDSCHGSGQGGSAGGTIFILAKILNISGELNVNGKDGMKQ